MAPTVGMYKLNYYATLCASTNCCGLEAAVREEASCSFAGEVDAYTGFSNVTVVEGLAVEVGLNLVLNLACRKIEVETDCLQPVATISAATPPLTPFGSIAMDIVDMLKSFDFHSFQYVPRYCNIMAHHLASFGCTLNSSSRWLNVAAPIISDVFWEDAPHHLVD